MHLFTSNPPVPRHREHRLGLAQIVAAGLLLFHSYAVVAAEGVKHRLSFPTDQQQVVLVSSTFPVSGLVTELIMPNWTPGSYMIREYAANVMRLSATNGDGVVLSVQKAGKDRWLVDTDRAGTLIVDYQVFTPDLGVRSSWASKEFSLINGASIFLYTEHSRSLPQALEVSADADRGEIFTALRPGLQNQQYVAASYDELVDNPVVVAKAPSYRFETGAQEYVFVNVGENEFWDGDKASQDIHSIVDETQSFWGINPLNGAYWFLNFAVERKGGLEHDQSTVIMAGRRQMRDREEYIRWLNVVAHEFFHVWNVRHMRPTELSEIDYQHEQYTSSLWLAEGLTSYYDSLLLSRARLITPAEYMKLLAKDIHRLEITPGRKLQPVTDASRDAWTHHYQPNANTINATISYYTKGAVIGFVLDAFLRKHSKGRRSLDEVMLEMFRLYSSKPYEADAFGKVIAEIGGVDALELLDTLLNSTTDPDVDTALDWYGLRLVRDPEAQLAGLNGSPLESGFGVIWHQDKLGLIVKSVLTGSSGAIAGIMPEDEVLAIGGERVLPDTLEDLMTSFSAGDKTTLLLARRGKVISLELTMEAALPERFDVVLQTNFGSRHEKRLQSLLGQNVRAQR